jgi:hypothetical protein
VLACHLWDTRGVPAMTTSMLRCRRPQRLRERFFHRAGSPLEQRWGGWWVTGDTGGAQHLGNIPVMPAEKNLARPRNPKAPLASVEGFFDLKGYPAPTSDVVALLVLAHETQLTNLIARAGWEARVAEAQPSADATARAREAANELADSLLFLDEAPLPGPVRGSSGFAEWFAAQDRATARAGRSAISSARGCCAIRSVT